MKPNIGIVNALIRITFGLTLLSWATARMVKRPYQNSLILSAMIGAMKTAEGITRYCPLTDWVKSKGIMGNGEGIHSSHESEGKKGNGKKEERKHRHLTDLEKNEQQ